MHSHVAQRFQANRYIRSMASVSDVSRNPAKRAQLTEGSSTTNVGQRNKKGTRYRLNAKRRYAKAVKEAGQKEQRAINVNHEQMFSWRLSQETKLSWRPGQIFSDSSYVLRTVAFHETVSNTWPNKPNPYPFQKSQFQMHQNRIQLDRYSLEQCMDVELSFPA